MKRNRVRLKNKVYPILWSGILVVSLYIIYRFASISLSDHIGQAELSMKDALVSNLCSNVMEEGSALVRFTARGEGDYSYPIKLVTDELSIQKFTYDNTALTAKAQDYTSLLGKDKNDLTVAVEAMGTNEVKDIMKYYKIDSELSKEYILTNGVVFNSSLGSLPDGESNQLQFGYTSGDMDYSESEDNGDSVETVNTGGVVEYTLEQLKDLNFLVSNFYIVDKTTKVSKDIFDGEKLVTKDMTLKQTNDEPQILIYHTHSKEGYIDSRTGETEDTVVGIGNILTDILKDKYDYNVIHDTTAYDVVDGVEDRNVAYNQAEDGLEKILKQNPTIEVVIDLHRDSGQARTVEIDGKETAKVMLFNGLSRDQDGPITYLPNPNLQDNLAFSLQLQLKSHQIYPGLFVKNYLKNFRFNMHVRPKSLLVELGTVNNTVESAKNAMEPFAAVLDSVLKGE